ACWPAAWSPPPSPRRGPTTPPCCRGCGRSSSASGCSPPPASCRNPSGPSPPITSSVAPSSWPWPPGRTPCPRGRGACRRAWGSSPPPRSCPGTWSAAMPTEPPGRFALDALDRLLHEKARLGILTALVTHPQGLLFNDLKALCALTDGNLSRHLHLLAEAGLVETYKGGRGRPQTLCRLTDAGRRRFREYLAALEAVVGAALAAEDAPARDRSRPGWSPA